MVRTQEELLEDIRRLCSTEEVTLRKNIQGNYTLGGYVPGDRERIYWSLMDIPRTIINIDNDHIETSVHVINGTSYLLSFNLKTEQLVEVYEQLTDHDMVHKKSISLPRYNCKLINALRVLGKTKMFSEVIPYTTLKMFPGGLCVNGKHENDVRSYIWYLDKVDGMCIQVDGIISVYVSEATPPVTISINNEKKICKIVDDFGTNRVDVEIPNTADFMKYLRVVKEITHLDEIKA